MLAPCCHPQIAWETYAGRAWLEGHGIDESAFGVLRDVVRRGQGLFLEEAEVSFQAWPVERPGLRPVHRS